MFLIDVEDYHKLRIKIIAIQIPNGSSVGSLSPTSQITFVSGDVLKMVAPAVIDSTLKNISVVISGILS